MASRTAGSSPQDKGVVLTAPTIAGTSTGGGGSSSSSSSQFTGIDNPEALSILMDFIQQTAGGGTAEQRAQREKRNEQIVSARGTLQDYTKQSAFTDAAELMAQNLRQSLEKNMPAISKSVQGAGTSAGSMQGLLSQKLATESAQAAGAMGAEQAKAYGGISAQLQGVLEALTRVDPSVEANLLKALELTKTSRAETRSSQVNNPTQSTTASGGGTFFQPIGDQGQEASAGGGGYARPAQAAYAPGPSGGFVLNEDTGSGTIFGGGGQYDFTTPVQSSGGYDYSAAEEDYPISGFY